MKKKNGYWNYETCMEESKKYKSRGEFCKGNSRAYNVAWKNGWLDEYTWFKRLVKPNGYWNYKTCMEESKKYKSRGEFCKGNSRAYKVALKNGWLDKYTWLGESKTSKKWNYKTCMEESKKYISRGEFCNGCSRAYNVALKNGWLDEYTWFKRLVKPNGYWTHETCMKESKKYKSRKEFCKGSTGAYEVARKNGWLDDFFPKCNDLAMAV